MDLNKYSDKWSEYGAKKNTIHYYSRLIAEDKLSQDQFRRIHRERFIPAGWNIEKEVIERVEKIRIVVEGNDGVCDDCRQFTPRISFGRLQLCAVCVISRKKIKKDQFKKIEREADPKTNGRPLWLSAGCA